MKKELELVKKITGKEPIVIAMGRTKKIKTAKLLEKYKDELGIKNPIQTIPFHNVYGIGRKMFRETAEERINKYAEEIKNTFQQRRTTHPTT